MKLKLTYLPEEQEEADAALAAILHLCPSAKVKKSDKRPPYRHIYVTTKKAGTHGGCMESA